MTMSHPSIVKMTYEYQRKAMSLPGRLADDEILNASLLATYQIATCGDGGRCRGGDHIIESLTGRAYNLALSSVLLCSAGLYDEALNSMRSLGEVANILGFLWLYPERYPEWVLADRRKRLTEFSPAKVRKAIEAKGKFVPPMDKVVYAQLCEVATHVHGNTAPNPYGRDGRRHVGGVQQEAGVEKVAEQLSYVLSMVAMLSGRMVGRDDLFELVVRVTELEPPEDSSAKASSS